ncbi:MAG TPA: chemotaxis protein CheW [Acidobacteriaceae bacterium]
MKEAEPSQAQQVCTVRVGETLYGVPIAHVLEILGKPSTQPVPLAPYFVGGLVHYRGEVLTAVSLRKVLGMEAAQRAEDVVVFEGPDGPFGLFVDEVGEVLNVNSAEHEPNPPTLDSRWQALFGGAWKLKDSLLVTLDPGRLDPMRLDGALRG